MPHFNASEAYVALQHHSITALKSRADVSRFPFAFIDIL